MTTFNQIPDPEDFAAFSKYLYNLCCDLDETVRDFTQSTDQIGKIPPKKLAQYKAKILNLVDDIYILSGAAEEIAEIISKVKK